MRVRVLGLLEVERDGQVLDLGGHKPRALVGLLVASAGRPVPVEHLIDQIWGDRPPVRVEASLQSYVARLRRVLEPSRGARTPAQVLRTHPGGYSLHVPAGGVDAQEFTRLLAEVPDGAGDPVPVLTSALALWRGTAYSGLDCPALSAEATRLEELRMGAVERLWQVRLDRGERTEAVAELEQLVQAHPLRERLWGLLVLALYRSARQGDALAALRRARDHLAQELGVDPGPELQALEARVLQQHPSLDVPLTPVDAQGVEPTREHRRPRDQAPADAGPPQPAHARRGGGDDQGLFGRQQALAGVERVIGEVAAGRGRVVLVSGEAGIGKSRFVEAVVAAAERRGVRAGRGVWEAEGNPPLWGWTRAVRQVVDRPDVLDVGQTDASSASYRQADALLDALGPTRPTVLALDDLHWADAGSLRLLRRLAAELDRAPLLLVLATRDAPSEVGPLLAETLGLLTRRGVHRVDLSGLDPQDVREWVAVRHGIAISREVADQVIARTDGNPFFVSELVRLLVAEGVVAQPGATSWSSVPTGVRDVVRQRLAQVDPEVARVAGTAAVAGREFDVAVVAAASGVAFDAALERLEPLLMMGLLDEVGPGRARFSHALVRDAVHEALSPTARSRAHASVAAAIEAHHQGRVAEHSAELAEHYRLAGPAYARSSWLFAAAGAEGACARSAHDEALRLSDLALELQRADPALAAPERERLLVDRARALVGLSRPVDAWWPAAEAARSALDRADVPAAVRALLVVTEDLVWGWRGHPDWDDAAIALWREVRDRLGDTDPPARARVTAALAYELFLRPGADEESERLAEEALSDVRRASDDPHERLAVLQLATSALLRPELVHRRLALHDETLELARVTGAHAAAATTLSSRASDRATLGMLDQARSDVLRSCELAQRHHVPQALVVTGWITCTLLQMEGRLEQAEQAVADTQALEATLAMAGRGIELAQLANVRDLQGRLAELEPALAAASAHHPAFVELHALSMVACGRLDELRLRLGAYDELVPVHRDYMWLGFTCVRARCWAALGDQDAVADLRAQLAPYADMLAGTIAVTFQGCVHHTLGHLALVADDHEAAAVHLRRAREVHERLGLELWVARTDELLARL